MDMEFIFIRAIKTKIFKWVNVVRIRADRKPRQLLEARPVERKKIKRRPMKTRVA